MEIDHNSKIPKYLQIRSWLYGMIRRGKIIVGDKLTTEEELAKRFGVNSFKEVLKWILYSKELIVVN